MQEGRTVIRCIRSDQSIRSIIHTGNTLVVKQFNYTEKAKGAGGWENRSLLANAIVVKLSFD